ncbi:MAG: Holliday junction branch migration DNA helicase RuvB [Planctomycetota bacterium]|nr:MAG: Holliday junction branch migration DNA helicase RuvB [Planctomycetota bacterium]
MDSDFSDHRIISGESGSKEQELEKTLRPKILSEFTGQDTLKSNLNIYIEAAKKRNETLDHVLFSGPPGLGKTTLARIIAEELDVEIIETSGPSLEKPGDLAGILTSLSEGDVLFVDEIHRLPTIVEEYLYSAMEDFFIDIVIDSGPGSRSVKLPLPKFTLAGATTREGNLSSPFRERFGIREKFQYYGVDDLEKIVKRSASLLKTEITEESSLELAKRCRGTPRVANRFLRRVRDLADVKGNGLIDHTIAMEGLSMLGVDENGLEELDRKILSVLIRAGKPVGLKTLAISVNEAEVTIEDTYEPFLIQQGYLEKSDRGRTATKLAYEHLKIDKPNN